MAGGLQKDLCSLILPAAAAIGGLSPGKRSKESFPRPLTYQQQWRYRLSRFITGAPARCDIASWQKLAGLNILPDRESYQSIAKGRDFLNELTEDDKLFGVLWDTDLDWVAEPDQKNVLGIAQINANEPLEDRAVVTPLRLIDGRVWLLAGVLDGHGGWQVADYAQRKLPALIERELNRTLRKDRSLTPEAAAEAIRRAFELLDANIMEKVKGTCELGLSRTARVGSCCICSVVTEDAIITANAGDCRAVLSTSQQQPLSLSNPHSANEPRERERLRREHPDEDDIVKCKRNIEAPRQPATWRETALHAVGMLGTEIVLDACYVKGRLQPTRSFGDFYLKDKSFAYDYENDKPFVNNAKSFPYISASPEITIQPRCEGKDEFLLLGSDGVWDFLSPKEAVLAASEGIKESPQRAAESVVKSVLLKASKECGIPISQMAVIPAKQRRQLYDDTTVTIVSLTQGYLVKDAHEGIASQSHARS